MMNPSRHFLALCALFLAGSFGANGQSEDEWGSQNTNNFGRMVRTNILRDREEIFIDEKPQDDVYYGSGDDFINDELEDMFSGDDEGSAVVLEPTRGKKQQGHNTRPDQDRELEIFPSDSDIQIDNDRATSTEFNNKIAAMPESDVEIETVDPSTNQVGMLPSRSDLHVQSSLVMSQPGILAGIIGGALVGLLCAVLLVMFIVYRMRKKDEGSYALDERKHSPSMHTYARAPTKEFYA